MTTVATTEKRSYLGKDDRRKFLLVCASELVETQGWAALTMSALAVSANVSRQLIYQHFPNLESLLSATSVHIFMGTMEATQQAISSHSNDLRAAIRSASLVSLDLPVGRGDALWQLIAGMSLGSPELEKIRLQIRDVILSLWVPSVSQTRQINQSAATSLVWMCMMSFWGIRQLIRDGVITREQGIESFDQFLDNLVS